MSVRLLLPLLTVACAGGDASEDTAREPVVDADGDGWPTPQDCDDALPGINPGVTERCNGEDDDCDGVTDDTPMDGIQMWLDRDLDGWGDPATGQLVCEAFVDDLLPWAYVDGDCDDGDSRAYPGGTETCGEPGDEDCDGISNDPDALGCSPWYEDRDGDGAGTEASACLCEAEGAWRATSSGDCDDDDDATTSGCPATGARLATDADVTLYGAASRDGAGIAVASGGDADADGWPDLLVMGQNTSGGAQWFRMRGPFSETADLRAPSAHLVFSEWTSTSLVGGNGAHDLDGDGVTDILAWGVGRLNSRNGGRAWVVGDDPRGEIDLSLADATLVSGNSSSSVVFEADVVGDRAGDGVDDIALTDTTQSYTWIVSGPLSGEVSIEDADVTVQATGRAIDDAGDLDGDGAPELLIANSTTGFGAAWVVSGSATGSVSSTATGRIIASDGVIEFGRTAAGLGDLDGDGYAEFGLGGWESGVSRVWIFTGLPDGLWALSEAIATLSDTSDFEAQIDGAGDLDGDGHDDLVIGSPEYAGRAIAAGAARVFYGPVFGTGAFADADLRIYGVGEGDLLGYSVTAAGDLDLDGLSELLIGGPGVDVGAAEAGAAWVYAGAGR